MVQDEVMQESEGSCISSTPTLPSHQWTQETLPEPQVQTPLPQRHRHSMSVSSIMDIDDASCTGASPANGWHLPPLQEQHKFSSPALDSSTTSTADSLFSKTAETQATAPSYASGLSADDPDVRLAAEALEDLRASGGEAVVAPQFLDRVSTYPIVSTAVRAYEQTKHTSRGFRYGADMFESVARPVARRFEPLDEFACRQLDRIEGRCGVYHDLESGKAGLVPGQLAQEDAKTQHKQTESIPRWQSVLAGASGLTVSLSEESIKSLRYCAEWLHYANSHLAQLLQMLQGCIGLRGERSQADRTDASTTIMTVKREIVGTLKKVFEVVSRYAMLPEPGRSAVRVSLLALPRRWAAKQKETPQAAAAAAAPAPAQSTTTSNGSQLSSAADDERIRTEAARVQSLAKESMDMLHSVTEAVDRTLASSEGWSKWRSTKPAPAQQQNKSPGLPGSYEVMDVAVDLPLPRVPMIQTTVGQ